MGRACTPCSNSFR